MWTENRAEAARIIALSEDEFHAELEQRFGLHLGEIRALDKPRAFPLGYFVARSFIGERLALVGDAAHVIHPIAGQGLNMGLKDIAALAEVIVDAARLGMDLGQADVLERYQRWRRFDTMAMGLATNSLNLLFSNKSTLLRSVRDIGLGLVDRMPPLKSAVHPPGRGAVGRSAEAVEGRGVVELPHGAREGGAITSARSVYEAMRCMRRMAFGTAPTRRAPRDAAALTRSSAPLPAA